MRASEEKIRETLEKLGYTMLKPNGSEWRRKEFHLFIRRKRGKKSFLISLHEDVSSRYPPFHKSQDYSEKLDSEMKRILSGLGRT